VAKKWSRIEDLEKALTPGSIRSRRDKLRVMIRSFDGLAHRIGVNDAAIGGRSAVHGDRRLLPVRQYKQSVQKTRAEDQ